eukprot:CAMPEP_0113502850 /NCGR_PEP_ID=MMETSP0014_2-20120614/33809_1 /TAXON_ID=2857 /ORGANISM="Nitzschia sp." /LENGTH=636 /DNA_ID=CAMNT_0000397735 /DNA_START=50 /DNA_END=1960 /DNA_ORIENTATION=+ /assembly_acc=CAM_ASM_000159
MSSEEGISDTVSTPVVVSPERDNKDANEDDVVPTATSSPEPVPEPVLGPDDEMTSKPTSSPGPEPKMPTSTPTPATTEEPVTTSASIPKSSSSSDTTTPIPTGPSPLQIVSIGTEDDQFAFTFHEEKLNAIMSKIPPGWKVAVVAVVGAFRTGKSFLLSWFLTYLHALPKLEDDEPGELVDEHGSKKSQKKWFEQVDTIKTDGFHWKAGSERDTTGIWMWSQPFFRKNANGEQMAVLLVDSQGMFDNETTMKLTSSIFGLSTLLSSYQIYNVDKRIQEDNLQQLALFSEYARTADSGSKSSEGIDKTSADKPFQTIEFLVRDWQHFEDEEDCEKMEKEMVEYLEKVISEREAKDLQDTREQIQSCFQDVTCYGLTHPGMAVIKKNFQGEVAKMDETFLNLLERYCRHVFSEATLQPKMIHGREVTAIELASYIKAYAQMFSSGAEFPEASTMLDATATTNNTNAVNLAVREYKDIMSRIAGPNCSNYIKPKELEEEHRLILTKALATFDSIATFGNKRSRDGARQTAIDQINEDFVTYSSLNEARNPLSGLEQYALPLTVMLVSYILRAIFDWTCSPFSEYCRNASENLSHVSAVVFFFLVMIGVTKAKQVKDLFDRLKAVVHVVMNEGGGKAKKD